MEAEKIYYDPAWLEAETQMGGRVTLPRETPQQARDHFHQLWSQIEPLLPAPDAAVRTEDVFIQPDQRIRIYTPAKAAAEASSPLPVGLYIHCGGWYSGSIDIEDFLCRNVAENAGIILFSPDYRLAPENPYPAGFEDVCRAYEWMHDHAATYGGDAQRKFTMGGSAGGNLSACVAVKYAAHETLRVSGFISACLPACDPKCLPEKYRPRFTPELYPNAPMVGSETLAQAREWYRAPADEPTYSPLLHPDIKLLKQAYVTATTADATYQETLFFAEELKSQGVDVDYVEWVGWPHYFWINPSIPKSIEFMSTWNEKLCQMIAKS